LIRDGGIVFMRCITDVYLHLLLHVGKA
jgi:hypothetical protein